MKYRQMFLSYGSVAIENHQGLGKMVANLLKAHIDVEHVICCSDFWSLDLLFLPGISDKNIDHLRFFVKLWDW